MSQVIFWGEKGEYGPFTVQSDGWPNAGEVVRHYRKRLNISARELAIQYGKATSVKVTARWMLKMEQQNRVPTDIMRRRMLAKILEIPPILLGLASIEQIAYSPTIETRKTNALTTLKSRSDIDIAKYNRYVDLRWLLSYTGEESTEEILKNIEELAILECQSSGDLQRDVRKILNSYYQLASDITRHQGHFSVAWFYANNAVRVTKFIGINDLLAAALYRRGYTTLEWAIFGDKVAQCVINREPDRQKVKDAITDFEMALPNARQQLKGAVWLELSRAQAILKNTTISLSLVGQAQNMVASGSTVTNPIEQILLEGALNGLSEGMYLLGKTASLIAMGRTRTALDVLDDFSELKSGKGIASNQIRRLAYADILRAEAYLGEKDYIASAICTTNAFKVFRDIGNIERIAWTNDLYKRVVEKQKNSLEVKELGKMLTEYKS